MSEQSSGSAVISDSSSGSLLERVEKMVEVLTAEKWDEFKTYFTPDLFYKVGAFEPKIGPQGAADFLFDFYQVVKPTVHDIRGTWEEGNVVIVEMDANYRRLKDGKTITLPCCDVYRFEGDLIKEWRVYPDINPVYAD